MFAMIATLVFVTAAAFSTFVIATMFAAYREKMVAALLFQPMPQTTPVYHVEIRRRHVRPMSGHLTLRIDPVVLAA